MREEEDEEEEMTLKTFSPIQKYPTKPQKTKLAPDLKIGDPDLEIGSCRVWKMEMLNFVQFLPDNCAHLILMDPPYGGRNNGVVLNLDPTLSKKQLTEISQELVRVLMPEGVMLIFSESSGLDPWKNILENLDTPLIHRRTIIWRKPGRGVKPFRGTVWNIPNCTEEIHFFALRKKNYLFAWSNMLKMDPKFSGNVLKYKQIQTYVPLPNEVSLLLMNLLFLKFLFRVTPNGITLLKNLWI